MSLQQETEEMNRMMERLSEMNPDKFIEIDDMLIEKYHETEEYIDSLREVAGLY